MKRYDLMNQVNVRGTFLCGQKCLPYLKKSEHAHILTLSPPLDFRPEYFGPHVAYSIAKLGMSLCTLGWAEELRPHGVAAVAAHHHRHRRGAQSFRRRNYGQKGRHPEIVAEAAYEILTRPPTFSGNFLTDEDILRQAGCDRLLKLRG